MRAPRVPALVGLVTFVALGPLGPLGACKRSETARPDPAALKPPPSGSASMSASASGSTSGSISDGPSTLAELLPPYECDDDTLRTATPAPAPVGGAGADAGFGSLLGDHPGDSFDYGGLGMSGTGAGGGDRVDGGRPGEGLGLGTIGPLGHGSGTGFGPGHVPSYKPLPRKVTGKLLAPAGTNGLPAARVLCAAGPSMRLCAEAASTEAKPANTSATYAITLRPDGSVDASKVTIGAIADASLAACLEKALAARTFPAGTPSLTYAVEIGAGTPKAIKMRESGTTVAGRLPPEVIKRIVRANFPRFRACYEALRKTDPNATGTVSTTLVIDETGAATSVKTDAGTLTDATMRGCVQRIFATMSFPEPEGGKVKVTYPIDFRVD
jgi:hypothetical protein